MNELKSQTERKYWMMKGKLKCQKCMQPG